MNNKNNNNLWGTYDLSGRFSWWLADDEYEPRHSAIFFIASRQEGESDEDWHRRWVREVERREE